MRVLWAINGWGQSAGWSLMVQTLSNWNTSSRRGTLIGRLSTCYTVGNVLSWVLAGFLCDSIGWRAAFLVPGLLLLPDGAGLRLCSARYHPSKPDSRRSGTMSAPRSRGSNAPDGATIGWDSTWHILRLTLSSRVLWILAIGFFVMNAVRYSFMNWSVQYMADFHGRSIKNSALTAVMIPLVGSSGRCRPAGLRTPSSANAALRCA